MAPDVLVNLKMLLLGLVIVKLLPPVLPLFELSSVAVNAFVSLPATKKILLVLTAAFAV